MLKILLTFSISIVLFFSACDVKHPPEEVDYDKVQDYDTIKTYPPYSFDKFKDVLDESNYQYLHSTTTIYNVEYNNFKFKAFYADKNGDLYFSLDKKMDTIKERSELRQELVDPKTGKPSLNIGWKTSDKNGNFWVAEVRCFKPQYTESYTWMQVHGIKDVNITLNDGSIVKSFNYPIIRLLWERYRDGIYDHIWAIVITSYPRTPKIYDWIDLGPRPDDFFDAEVHFKDNIMKIIINYNLVASYDVTYWGEEINYFKAGIYINRFSDGGKAYIAYRELHFYHDDTFLSKR